MPEITEVVDNVAEDPADLPVSDIDDDESDVSLADDEITPETLEERIEALQEILPEAVRAPLVGTGKTVWQWGRTVLKYAGKAGWTLGVVVLVLGLPLDIKIEEENYYQAMEKEHAEQIQQQRQILQPALYGEDANVQNEKTE